MRKKNATWMTFNLDYTQGQPSEEKKMQKITFNVDFCKGCGLCVDACPKKILRISPTIINKKGHHPAEITNQDECVACASCAIMCPDCIITVEK